MFLGSEPFNNGKGGVKWGTGENRKNHTLKTDAKGQESDLDGSVTKAKENIIKKEREQMETTKKSIWKRVIAVVSVVVLAVTAVNWPIGKAEAAAADVTKIILPIIEGLTWA